MRTIAITQNITMDGSIEFLGDWFDPTAEDPDQLALVGELSARSDGLLVGRKTFEDFRSYWPAQTDDQTGITAHLNAVQKYVVSSTIDDPGWANTTVLAGDLVAEVEALKKQDGRDIVVTGSIQLCHALITAGLVDAFRLFTYPVVQGRGRRLFPDGSALTHLRLDDVHSFRSGVTYSGYSVV
jgi:dihydrofolate reductase